MRFLNQRLTTAVLLAVVSVTARASDNGVRPGLLSVTGLTPMIHCSSKHSSKTSRKCEGASGAFGVQVVGLFDEETGVLSACVAYFGYNGLTFHTTKGGEATNISWKITRSPGIPATADIDFTDIAFFDLNNNPVPAPFTVTSKTTKQGKDKVTLAVDSTTTFQQLNHKPLVTVNLIGGKSLKCDGGDPTIANSGD